MSKQIEVRIRHVNDTVAARLTHWEMDDLDGVLRLIKSWGLADGDGDTYDEATFGQIKVDGKEAYFEVVFGGDE